VTEEIDLPGGQINTVVRVGDTVRRTLRWDRAQPQELLRHLEGVGFEGAPRFLGLDAEGRETLTFLPGHVPYDTGGFTDAQLAAAARLLRRYHDATAGFAPVGEAGAEVMCHNDWTPANTVFADDMPYGIIDFDTAAPGTRLWDLAYSVWTWLDLGDPDYSGAEQRRRIGVFVAAYGHPDCTLQHVAGYLPTRQAGVVRWARQWGMAAGAEWAMNAMDWTLEHITEQVHPNGRPPIDRP